MKVTVNVQGIEGIAARLLAMPSELERRITETIYRDIWIVSQRSQQNADGPRPSNLGQKTGDLYKSLGENVTVTTQDNMVIGETGTDVTAANGFSYPKYWEGVISQGKGAHSPWPRPFLRPALDSIADQFVKDIQDAVKEQL